MNSKKLFLLFCIPTRIALALLAYKLDDKYLRMFGLLLLIIAISFLILYFFNLRLNAFEAGGKTWWKKYRIIHGLLYLIAAIFAIQRIRLAHYPLLLDVLIGLTLFVIRYL